MVKPINPSELDYQSYFDKIFTYNLALQNSVSSQLFDYFADMSNGFCIATTGSDARLEKGPVSPFEIMVYLIDSSSRDKMIYCLQELIFSEEGKKFFDTNVEFKDLHYDSMAITNIQQPLDDEIQLVSPNRILDSRALFGNNHLVEQGKLQLANEIISPSGKNIYKNIKGKVKHHSSVNLTGIQEYKKEQLGHYDLEEGISHYDPDLNLWSFKQGPLRLVQFALVRDIIKRLRRDNDPTWILNLHHNTGIKVGVLDLENELSLPSSQAHDLIDSYKYFLWCYHNSQHSYHTNNQTEVPFNAYEVKERCDDLSRICESPIIK